MKKKALLSLAAVLLMAGTLYAHDLFLKLSTYFLPAHADVTVMLINGTFEKSENAIARNRMLDVSIVGPEDEVTHPDTTQWHDEDNAALLDFKTGAPGTYVLGVSTAPRIIELSAEDFNTYLEHDGVLDVLAARKKAGTLGEAARERYAKHVKALVQVGDARSGSYDHVLGYPVEIIPMVNPYTLGVGGTFEARVLKDGKPVADQLVYASYDGHHGHDAAGDHQEAITTRTDAEGIAGFDIGHEGRWYVRLIHMVAVEDAEADYASEWATLTFEIK